MRIRQYWLYVVVSVLYGCHAKAESIPRKSST